MQDKGHRVSCIVHLTSKDGGCMTERKPRILCVDDEPVDLKLFEAALAPEGYEVIKATNGKEALEIIKEQGVDIVFLDVMMPEMDGYEICRRLKKNPLTQHIPIVMVTALSDKESKIKGLEAGANDFLTKPVDRIELLIRTNNLLKIKEFADFLKQHNELLDLEVKKAVEALQKSEEELKKRVKELEEFYNIAIGRELRMKELKEEMESLKEELGKYKKA